MSCSEDGQWWLHSYLLLFTLNLFNLLKSAFLIFVEYIIVSVRYIPLYCHELCCCFHHEQYDVLQELHFWYWHHCGAGVNGTMPLPSGVCWLMKKRWGQATSSGSVLCMPFSASSRNQPWQDSYPIDITSHWREDWSLASVVISHLLVYPTIRQPSFELPRRLCTAPGDCGACGKRLHSAVAWLTKYGDP